MLAAQASQTADPFVGVRFRSENRVQDLVIGSQKYVTRRSGGE